MKSGGKKGLKPIPKLMTDEHAAEFVEKANLVGYNLLVFRPACFRFERKERRV